MNYIVGDIGNTSTKVSILNNKLKLRFLFKCILRVFFKNFFWNILIVSKLSDFIILNLSFKMHIFVEVFPISPTI